MWLDFIGVSRTFLLSQPSQLKTCSYIFPASVIYYNWKVPEGERHDSAVKRNREVLSAEVKLWEGYLEKVKLKIKYYHCMTKKKKDKNYRAAKGDS